MVTDSLPGRPGHNAIKPIDWIRPEIRSLTAYAVPKADGLIKLDAMENPFGWPDALKRDWLAQLADVSLNRYPDASATDLKLALREAMAIPANADILLGNGSDEIIQMLAMSVAGTDRVLLAPEPGFVMYHMIAGFVGMQYAGVPLGDGFSLDVPAMLSAIAEQQPALIFIAQPNNPTGNVYADTDLRAIIEAAPGLVVIDEAYAPFTDASCMSWLDDAEREYGNLLVMRTVSKLGLAGLRLGLLAGPSALIAEIEKLRLPYNIGSLTQASARFALAHGELFAEQARIIRTERARIWDELQKRPNLVAYPSEANFILFRAPHGQARAIHQGLLEAGVLIKCVDGTHPQLAGCLRVTIGKVEENNAFLAALDSIIEA